MGLWVITGSVSLNLMEEGGSTVEERNTDPPNQKGEQVCINTPSGFTLWSPKPETPVPVNDPPSHTVLLTGKKIYIIMLLSLEQPFNFTRGKMCNCVISQNGYPWKDHHVVVVFIFQVNSTKIIVCCPSLFCCLPLRACRALCLPLPVLEVFFWQPDQ